MLLCLSKVHNWGPRSCCWEISLSTQRSGHSVLLGLWRHLSLDLTKSSFQCERGFSPCSNRVMAAIRNCQFDMGWVWRWGSYLPNSLGQRPHGWFLRLGRYCLQRVTRGDVAHIMITQIIQSRQGRVLSGSSLEFWILSLLSNYP